MRVLAFSRAWEARGDIEREDAEAAVDRGLDLRIEIGTESAEVGVAVLARWLEDGWRCEGGAVGGGVGDASFGRTQDLSCLGSAISSASSISASRSPAALELLSEDVSQSSLSARVDFVIARGKLGANVERMRWLRRLEERVGWREEDSE